MTRFIGRRPPPWLGFDLHHHPPLAEKEILHPTIRWGFRVQDVKYIVEKLMTQPERGEHETWMMVIQRLPGNAPWPKRETRARPGPDFTREEVRELRARLVEQECKKRQEEQGKERGKSDIGGTVADLVSEYEAQPTAGTCAHPRTAYTLTASLQHNLSRSMTLSPTKEQVGDTKRPKVAEEARFQ